MELKVRVGSEAWLRRYKNFRDLEERAAWLSERLETATADLEQLRDQIERDRAGVQLAQQVLAENLVKARACGVCGNTKAHAWYRCKGHE